MPHPATTFNHRMLLQWRHDDGRRAEEVCAAAGCSFSYLRMLEDGHRANPSATLLARLAAVYGRSLDELFTDTEPAGAA
jgi:transcriptional regulator with XRE-family HTH domain